MAFVVLTKSEVMGMRPRIGLRSHGVPFGGWGSSCGASGQGEVWGGCASVFWSVGSSSAFPGSLMEAGYNPQGGPCVESCTDRTWADG